MEKRKPALLYLGNRLQKHGKNPTGVDFLGDQLQAWGYRLTRGSAQKNKALRFLHMHLLLWKSFRQRPLVLIDTYSSLNFWFAVSIALNCRLLGLKYICLLHGGNLPYRLEHSAFWCRALFGKASANVSLSDFLAQRFALYNYSTQVIPNGFSIEDYAFKSRNNFAPKLLWVRSFAEIYDPLLAVKVLEALYQDYPQAELCMVGPWDDLAYPACKAYAERHNLPVRFTGKLSKAAWHQLAKDYSFFINTTRIDNTPMSVMEAMALGLAVVSTDVGGIPALVEQDRHALLVPSQNLKAFYQAICRSINEPEATLARCLAARAKAERLDWSVIKNKWEELLLNV